MTRTPRKPSGIGNRSKPDYEVGYRKPPVHSRFKPGGVGNPKGRPKKKKSVSEMIDDALMTRVKIEENGRTKMITAQEFIFRNLVRAAARGDTKATQLLFALRERYKDSPQTVLDVAELEQDDRRIIEHFLAGLPANSEPIHTTTNNKAAEGDQS
jgi:hypothetical protein